MQLDSQHAIFGNAAGVSPWSRNIKRDWVNPHAPALSRGLDCPKRPRLKPRAFVRTSDVSSALWPARVLPSVHKDQTDAPPARGRCQSRCGGTFCPRPWVVELLGTIAIRGTFRPAAPPGSARPPPWAGASLPARGRSLPLTLKKTRQMEGATRTGSAHRSGPSG